MAKAASEMNSRATKRLALPRFLMRLDAASLIWVVVRGLLLAGLAYIILFPLMTKALSSIMVERDLFDPTVLWIPRTVTFDNYLVTWRFMNYPVAFLHTIQFVILMSVLQLITSILVGYGLARFRVRGSGIVFVLVMFTLIVPPQTIMIPLYLNYRFFNIFGILSEPLNLIGSWWPFVLMSVSGTGLRCGLFIYIMRQFFKGMPRDLEEAAYVDGAGPFAAFFRVMLPSAGAAIVVVFLFSLVWMWNEYFLTSIFIGGGDMLSFSLSELAGNVYMAETGSGMSTNYASILNNTGMLMFIAPLLILYAFMQRFFVESVERTGIVG